MKRILCLLLVLDCGGAAKTQPQPKLNRWGKPYKEGVAVPSWVDKIPETGKGKLLAVGYAQPSFWPSLRECSRLWKPSVQKRDAFLRS